MHLKSHATWQLIQTNKNERINHPHYPVICERDRWIPVTGSAHKDTILRKAFRYHDVKMCTFEHFHSHGSITPRAPDILRTRFYHSSEFSLAYIFVQNEALTRKLPLLVKLEKPGVVIFLMQQSQQKYIHCRRNPSNSDGCVIFVGIMSPQILISISWFVLEEYFVCNRMVRAGHVRM